MWISPSARTRDWRYRPFRRGPNTPAPPSGIHLLVALAVVSSCNTPPAKDVSRVADPDLAALVEIVGSQRLIEPRITGGFSFGAWQPQRRARDADWRLVAIAGRVHQQRPGSDLDAVITLLGGDHDAAIRLLERPGDNPARAPHRLSDLAAARLARWRSEGRAFDAVHALDDVGRAIALGPDLDEGWFNRALALEAVGLSRSARRAWQQFTSSAIRRVHGRQKPDSERPPTTSRRRTMRRVIRGSS